MEKSNFVIGYVIILCQMVGMQKLIDEPCNIESTGFPGVCKLLLDCPQIRDEVIKTQRVPQNVCGFQETHAIVCCPTNENKRKPDVITNTSSLQTECTLPSGTDASCVSIHDCLVLLDRLDAPTLRNRTCGPENQNKKDPHVCCEKHLIKKRIPIETTSTSNNLAEVSSLSTGCTLPDGSDAVCVAIQDCLILLDTLSTQALRNRRCGPKNQDKRRPQVCCEKHLVGKPRNYEEAP